MNGNQHATEAAALLAVNPGEYEIEKSKALATLALAYEQRTANLIAIWSSPESTIGAVTWSMGESALGECLEQIMERLDLA
jgi:hypothetical protein